MQYIIMIILLMASTLWSSPYDVLGKGTFQYNLIDSAITYSANGSTIGKCVYKRINTNTIYQIQVYSTFSDTTVITLNDNLLVSSQLQLRNRMLVECTYNSNGRISEALHSHDTCKSPCVYFTYLYDYSQFSNNFYTETFSISYTDTTRDTQYVRRYYLNDSNDVNCTRIVPEGEGFNDSMYFDYISGVCTRKVISGTSLLYTLVYAFQNNLLKSRSEYDKNDGLVSRTVYYYSDNQHIISGYFNKSVNKLTFPLKYYLLNGKFIHAGNKASGVIVCTDRISSKRIVGLKPWSIVERNHGDAK
jgi:hypothetical protein